MRFRGTSLGVIMDEDQPYGEEVAGMLHANLHQSLSLKTCHPLFEVTSPPSSCCLEST